MGIFPLFPREYVLHFDKHLTFLASISPSLSEDINIADAVFLKINIAMVWKHLENNNWGAMSLSDPHKWLKINIYNHKKYETLLW